MRQVDSELHRGVLPRLKADHCASSVETSRLSFWLILPSTHPLKMKLTVVSPLSLSRQRVLSLLVLGNFVGGVLPALLALAVWQSASSLHDLMMVKVRHTGSTSPGGMG